MGMANLDLRKKRFVETLLAGLDVEEAAVEVGRSPRTGRRWLRDPSIQKALSQAQAERLRLLSTAVMQVAGKGLGVLEEVLDDPAAPAYVRVAAAKAVLDCAMRLYEFANLSERIEALEEQLGGTWRT